jgi:D-alanine-D-alanine ligase
VTLSALALQARGAGRRLSVAIVQGGPSSEAEVSRASAAGVAAALKEAGHTVVRLELDAFLAESLRTGGYDVVFPVAHGHVGEDGALQGLLEVLSLAYVGSGVLASALAMHKRVARVLFERAGLPVARGTVATRGLESAAAAVERARRDVSPRLVVKPSSHGSAIGVSRHEADAPTAEVAQAIEGVWAMDEHAVIEHFARGREVTCGVLDLGRPEALPPTEVLTPNDAFYTFRARYAPGRSQHVCPAELPPGVTERVQAVATLAHAALSCRDLSRVDFVVGDDGQPDAVTLLEVNTLPGMTGTSLFPEAAARRGLTMPDLCASLVAQAHARHEVELAARDKSRAEPLPL